MGSLRRSYGEGLSDAGPLEEEITPLALDRV